MKIRPVFLILLVLAIVVTISAIFLEYKERMHLLAKEPHQLGGYFEGTYEGEENWGYGKVVHTAYTIDRINMQTKEVFFKRLKDWHKKENVKTSMADILLMYTKSLDNPIPSIAITKDWPDKSVYKAIDFTREMRNKLMQATTSSISEPKEIKVNGIPGSYMVLEHPEKDVYTIWYQFFIEGTILTVEFSTTYANREQDVDLFKNFINSMKVQDNPS